MSCMQGNKLVSVIMPAFNAELTVARALKSVLDQTYTNFELFIIDDCSNDHTVDVIDTFSDPRVSLIKNIENMGAPKSRNIAIEMAQGRFICFLDADDEWLPRKLELQVRLLESSNAALSAHGYKLISTSGKSTVCMPPKEVSYEQLLRYNVISNCATMIDMSVISKKIYFKDLRSRQDWAMSLEITKQFGPAVCVQEELLNVYLQKQSIGSNKMKAVRDQWKLYFDVENISFLLSLKLLIIWAVLGLLKYSSLSRGNK